MRGSTQGRSVERRVLDPPGGLQPSSVLRKVQTMTLTRISLVGLVLLGVLAVSPAAAVGYKVETNAPKDWEANIARLAVVLTECDASLNCEDVRKQTAQRLAGQASKLPFKILQDREIEALVGWTWEKRGSGSDVAVVFEKTVADALFEIQVPFARGGAFGAKGAEVRVRARVIARDGDTRMSGDCSGQAFNTVSSPENIARHCALRILGEGLGANLD